MILHFWWIRIMTKLHQLFWKGKRKKCSSTDAIYITQAQWPYLGEFKKWTDSCSDYCCTHCRSIMNMFTNKPSLNGLFTFEMLGLLINHYRSQSYLLLFQLLYLNTSGKTKFLSEVQITQIKNTRMSCMLYYTLQEKTIKKQWNVLPNF